MLTKLEIFLLATFFGISTALFATAIVLAILHHTGRIPRTYINQYNTHPTINYVLPQQPPLARIRSPIHHDRLSEIHELSSTRCQQKMEDVASMHESVPENRIDTHPGTPVILLSSTSSSSALSSESTPYVVRSPSPITPAELTERLHRFQMVQRGVTRAPTPYPCNLSGDHTRNVPSSEPNAPDSDDCWDPITPSAFLSISTFILPREPCTEDPDYPTITD